MRVLKFIVNDQIITKDPSCDFSNLISGTEGYLTAKFDFSSDWNRCAKAAVFYGAGNKEYPLVLKEDNTCVIPPEATERHAFGVSVVGKSTDYKLITNKLIVRQN